MSVVVSPRAEKQIRKLAKFDQMAILDKIELLPETSNVKKLGGYDNLYRVRVGNYRIVYREFGDECYVELVGHRKDVYKKLLRLKIVK